MKRQTKWCGVFFSIIFLMCPKRTRLTILLGQPSQGQQEYYHAARRSSDAKISLPNNEIAPDIDGQSAVMARDIQWHDVYEPGFDLTDEEIRKFKLWPNGMIPYYIDNTSFTDKVLHDVIRYFLNKLNSIASLNFVELSSPPTDNSSRWVFFINRISQLGCADYTSKNFTNEGVQRVLLGYDCLTSLSGLAAIILALLGVPAQHNAPNRDDYIRVIKENIIPGKEYLFEKLHDTEWLFHSIPYDFTSVSHFDSHKHSINGQATIKPKDIFIKMGEAHGFSYNDIWKIKMLYNYISTRNNNVATCNKLFMRGAQFNSLALPTASKKPRRKPNKYLGVEGEDEESRSNEDSAKIGSNEDGEKYSNDNGTESNNSGDTKESKERKIKTKNATRNKGRNKKARPENRYHDPLTYLSDYVSDDNNY